MDDYTTVVLTLIAIALFFLNLEILLRPRAADARFLDNTPTWGEIMDLKDVKDETERRNKIMEIYERMPLVRVEGGHVN